MIFYTCDPIALVDMFHLECAPCVCCPVSITFSLACLWHEKEADRILSRIPPRSAPVQMRHSDLPPRYARSLVERMNQARQNVVSHQKLISLQTFYNVS